MGKLVNRARMTVSSVATSTGTGTGTFTLGSAVSGYNTFANAGVNSLETISYVAEEGAKWEYGQSVYTSSAGPLTVARNPTYSSQGSGVPEAFTTASQVYIAMLKEDIQTDFMTINNQTVLFSYTLATGWNSLSVGPITVASGFTVTIPVGSRWLVL